VLPNHFEKQTTAIKGLVHPKMKILSNLLTLMLFQTRKIIFGTQIIYDIKITPAY